MTPPPPSHIDIVTVAIALATLLFGPGLAELVGPYAVIVLGAALGGAFSASRREPQSRGSTIGHMLLMIGLSIMVTVPLAYVGAQYIDLDSKWLLGPVAVLVSAVGHDWPRVGYWAFSVARGWVEGVFARKGGEQ